MADVIVVLRVSNPSYVRDGHYLGADELMGQSNLHEYPNHWYENGFVADSTYGRCVCISGFAPAMYVRLGWF